MRPEKSITIVNGTVHADPNTDPTTVPYADLLTINGANEPQPTPINSVQLALDAPVGQQVTVTLYAVGDAVPDASDPTVCDAGTRFYEVATGVVVPGRGRAVVKDLGGIGGLYYVRVTAETLVADATLHVMGGSN